MTCDEFKNRIVDLFDKEVDIQTQSECEKHIAECDACKEYYEEMMETYSLLRPKASPEKELTVKARKNHHRIWQIAAAAVIFFIGIVAGWNHLFSTSVVADTPSSFSLDQAIQCVRNVGSFEMDVYVRTRANENFDYIDPNLDFVKVNIQLLRQNDSTFYRVEKEDGRTVVCDGANQYMWLKDMLYVKGNLNSGFLGTFRNLLYPERLLSMQESAVELSKKNKVTRSETDSTVILTIEGTEKNQDLQELLKTGKMGECPVTIQNVFTKNDGLLRSVKVWLTWKGEKVEMMHVDNIRYNLMLSRSNMTALPKVSAEKFNNVTQQQDVKQSRLSILQKETATQAAQRIINCLISGKTEGAEEALGFYKNVMGILKSKFSGCKASNFIEKRDSSYRGVFVFYTLTSHDGTKQQMHVAVRNDNSQRIWILDGGI
jgi:hypothetical protein